MSNMTFRVWRTDKDKNDGKPPYTFTIREPGWEEVEMAMNLAEKRGNTSAGSKLLDTLWQSGDPEVRTDNKLRLAAALQTYVNGFDVGVSEIEGELNDTSASSTDEEQHT